VNQKESFNYDEREKNVAGREGKNGEIVGKALNKNV